jgi:hypothetical protein
MGILLPAAGIQSPDSIQSAVYADLFAASARGRRIADRRGCQLPGGCSGNVLYTVYRLVQFAVITEHFKRAAAFCFNKVGVTAQDLFSG